MQELNWDDLRFILAAARSASFAGAARRLRVNESTVARRITGAERCLNTQLFERNIGGLQPTKAGLKAIARAERIELDVYAIQNDVSGMDQVVAGSVRLTSVPIVINHVLVPELQNLLKAHPQLQLELVAEPRNLSLTKREADIALRLARPSRELSAVTRRIGQLEYAVYARKGKKMKLLPWIAYEDSMSDLPHARWIRKQMIRDEQQHSCLMVNDAEAILAGVKTGIGKSLLPVVVAEKESKLIRVDYETQSLTREVWVLIHPDMRKLARVRAVVDWLISIFQKND